VERKGCLPAWTTAAIERDLIKNSRGRPPPEPRSAADLPLPGRCSQTITNDELIVFFVVGLFFLFILVVILVVVELVVIEIFVVVEIVVVELFVEFLVVEFVEFFFLHVIGILFIVVVLFIPFFFVAFGFVVFIRLFPGSKEIDQGIEGSARAAQSNTWRRRIEDRQK